MEEYMIIIWVVSLFVGVIVFVKWWIATNDISAIKRKLHLQNDEGFSTFDSLFFAFVLAQEKEKAKMMLFEEMSKTREFREILSGIGDEYFQRKCDVLNDRYKRYLNALGMQEIDFTIIKSTQTSP